MELQLKDTIAWGSKCPPWCDGHIEPYDDTFSFHMSYTTLMTPTTSGYKVARRLVQYLEPGLHYGYEVSGPAGSKFVQMNEVETLQEFENRAGIFLDEYETSVEEWCLLQKETVDE